jgi:putative oxidoreductase
MRKNIVQEEVFMIKKIMRTNSDVAALALRVGLAIVMFPHGAQKLLGWFGGAGFHATMDFFVSRMHIPAPLAFLDIVTEFFAPLALVLGLCTRLASFGIGVVMVVAIALVHWHNGFFMNWNGMQKGEGIEYHLLMLTIVVALMIRGAGTWSLDKKMSVKNN